MCAKLAQNAVHGAMAGYTGFSVGIVRNSVCWIPITTLIKLGTNRLSIYDRIWQRLMSQNRQKSLVNSEHEEKARESIVKTANERKALYEKVILDVRRDNGIDIPFGSAQRKVEPEIDNA